MSQSSDEKILNLEQDILNCYINDYLLKELPISYIEIVRVDFIPFDHPDE